MKIVFRAVHNENFFGKLISWWTTPLFGKLNGAWRDGFSHVELKFQDDLCYSASQYENAVRAKIIRAKEPDWKTYDLKASKDEELEILMWLQSKEDAKYDYIGILGFVLDEVKHNESKQFCSELCCEAIRLYTDLVPAHTLSCEIDPNKLHKLLSLKI